MSVEDLTLEEIEEPDEYKEYNDKLNGTPYVLGYQGLQRTVKKGNSEELKTLSNLCLYQSKKYT